MSSRGRPPKNGTPFDRLLKKQCQKGVTASKSAGVVGKWGSASFTSIRAAPIISSSASEGGSRPKKFFKSKNSSSDYNDCESMVEPSVQAPSSAKVSKFFKHKGGNNAPVAPPVPPLRPLEVMPNQPAPPKSKENHQEEVMKVPPLKLRLKAGALIAPSVDVDESSMQNRANKVAAPPEKPKAVEPDYQKYNVPITSAKRDTSPKPDVQRSSRTRQKPTPVVQEDPESESDEESEEDAEISFKEPSLIISPNRSSSESSPVQKRSSPDELTLAKLASPPRAPSPVHAPPPPKVSRMTEPVKLDADTQKSNGAAPPARSYGRRFAKPEEKQTAHQEPMEVLPSSTEPRKSAFEAKPAPVVESVKEKESVQESRPVPSMVKAASVATTMNVAKELKSMPPPSESGVDRPTKKSIFKSKSQGERKGMSLYKHSFGASKEDKDEELRQKVFHKAITSMDFEEDFGGPSPTEMSFSANKLTRVTSEATSSQPDQTMQEVVSVKCPKAQKEYFTVIKNVKKAHQIQDSGEFQEFNDDVEYIMDGLRLRNSLSTRCLSTVTLATKCMEPPFRMHLRAHGTMNKFFAELRDAPKNPGLALCTATVLFVLSQDRLNMDMDRDSLELMLNLLDTDSRIKDALDNSGMSKRELEKNKQKVQDLCAAMKNKGHATNLSLENISADHLSMETLLSLTSKRAGEWFKEELRELGGLDHLVRTMSDCVGFLMADEISMWTEPLHNKLRKAGRVLKVLESVTHENEENCQYLLEFEKGKFLDLIHKLFKLLDEEVPLNPNRDINDKESVSHTLRESLFDVMRVYINLVHDYNQTSFGSKLAGEKSDTFDLVLHCLFVMPAYLPLEKRFDILVLTLTLLINLVEHCEPNRKFLLKTLVPITSEDVFASSGERKNAATALVQMFLEKEENARREETKTDAILDGVKDEIKNEEEKSSKKESKTEQEVIDETVAKLLQKAGRHMEDTLIASYITLIVGYLILDNKEHEATVRLLLPENNFSTMTAVLKKFFNFMNLTASSTVASNRGIKATEMILKYLEKIDMPEPKKEEPEEENFDDITLFDVTKDESSVSLDKPAILSMSNSFGFDDDFDKL